MAASPLKAGSIEALLADDERVVHELVSSAGAVEREMSGSVSTLSPAPDCGSVVAATTARVVLAVGGVDRGGEDAVFSIPYLEVQAVSSTDGFLSTEFTLETTDGETYSISPDVGDVEATEGHVQHIVQKVERVRTLLGKADRSTTPVDPDPALGPEEILSSSARSSFARAYSTLEDLAEKPRRGLSNLREEIEERWLENHFDRAEELRDRADTAVEENRETDAIEALEAAIETYDAAVSIAEAHEFETTSALRAAREAMRERLHEVQSGPVERAGCAVERARETTGDEAIRAWLRAYEEYGEALERDPVAAPVPVEDDHAAIRFQRAWVAGAAVAALESAARRTLANLDEISTHDAAALDRAEACVEEAAAIAGEYESLAPALDELTATVQEQRALREWEWGGEE